MHAHLLDPESGNPPQTLGEEIANSISHGVGLLAVLCGTPFLLIRAAQHGSAAYITGASIFSGTMILLYLASTLYHAIPIGPVKHRLRILEHMAIFVLIAGTYTPFTLGVLHGAWGWSLFGLIWGLAILGVTLKAARGFRYPVLFPALYIAMGWVVLVAIQPLWMRMPHAGFFWILGGGLAYTAGVVFYAIDYRMRYSHFIWHLFVLAGTTLHYFAVFFYAEGALP